MANKRFGLATIVSFACIPSAVWCDVKGAPSSIKAPNILFILADDLRPEVAGFGSPAITPGLDRLAKRTVQFDRAYCQQALCNPSRSSMLTGLRPDTLRLWCNGIHFRENHPNAVTLPEYFKQKGYATRCVGKIFHNWHTAVKGDPQSWSAPEFLHYANHGQDKPMVIGPLGKDFATAPRCECRDVADEAYYDGRVAVEAVRVLEQVKDKPFFLAVGFWKPHAPFNAPKKYWDLYDRARLPKADRRRPTGAPELAFHDGQEIRGLGAKQMTFTDEQAAEIRHGYFAGVSYMDAQLGKVLDALDRLGLADNTALVFAGDHGYHLGEHELWAKTSNFELDARVPLYVGFPGAKAAGKRTSALVELVDLFPTILDICKMSAPGKLDGVSLVPILNDPTATVKAAAYTQHPRPAYYDRATPAVPKAMGYSVRTSAVRYTQWRDWATQEVVARELYDAFADPNEMTNRADLAAVRNQQQEAERLLNDVFPIHKK